MTPLGQDGEIDLDDASPPARERLRGANRGRLAQPGLEELLRHAADLDHAICDDDDDDVFGHGFSMDGHTEPAADGGLSA